jgi:hypothetical protein
MFPDCLHRGTTPVSTGEQQSMPSRDQLDQSLPLANRLWYVALWMAILWFAAFAYRVL